MRTIHLLLLPMLWVGGQCRAETQSLDVTRYALKRDLIAAEEEFGEFGVFRLDAEIFAQSADGFSDLRVIDDGGNEVPLVVRERKESKIRERWVAVAVEIDTLETDANGNLEIVVKRPDTLEAVIEGFSIRTQLSDFEKSVVVKGSDDGKVWEKLGEPSAIYDYSRFLNNVRKTRVSFEPSSYLQFRLRIEAAVESVDSPAVTMIRESRGGEAFNEIEQRSFRNRPFKMEGIDALWVKEETVREIAVSDEYPAENLVVEEDREARSTVAEFDAGRIPIRAIRITTESKYTDRSVRIEAIGNVEDSEWDLLSKAQITSNSAVEQDGSDRSSHELGVRSGDRFSRIRVLIDNGDNPPLENLGFSIQGVSHEGVFYAEAGQQYALLYGDADAKSREYDIARVLGSLDRPPTISFTLGKPGRNPEFLEGQSAGDQVPGKTILIAVIVGVAIFLLFLVIRMSGAVDRVSGAEE